MDTAKLFQNGQSQAVRLPKAYRMKGKKVAIKRFGDAIILYPVGGEWALFDESLKHFTPDFMDDRAQPRQQQKRKRIFK